MQRIDGFSLFQKQLQETGRERPKMPPMPGAGRPDFEPVDTYEKSNTAPVIGEGVELSEGAKKLLEELKEKYTNMDFFVANYGSDEEAQRIMSHGTKDYSVLIEPETLEEMASSKEAYDKYTAMIDDATKSFDDIKEKLGDDAVNVDRISVIIDSDGTVKYFAHLQQMSDKQREYIDDIEAKKAKKEAAAEEFEKMNAKKHASVPDRPRIKPVPVKRTTVSADTADKLIEAIKGVDWDSIKAEKPVAVGSRFDYTV